MLSLSSREAIALVAFYVHGYSGRRIARGLACSHTSIQRAIRSGTRRVMDDAADRGVNAVATDLAHHFDGPLCWRAEQRQTDLWARVEEHVQQCDKQLEDMAYVMVGEDCFVDHRAMPELDQWEIEYLAERHRTSMTAADYEAVRLHRWVDRGASRDTALGHVLPHRGHLSAATADRSFGGAEI